MNEILLVAIGGFFGAILRFYISKQIQQRNGTSFPAGTLAVNLLGAFLLGLLFGLQIKGNLYALLGIGFMGAFTTFSTLMLESEQLRIAQKNKLFYSYIISSYIFGILLAFSGLLIGKML